MVTVYCKKTEKYFSFGTIGFDRLKHKIANLIGGEFSSHYLILTSTKTLTMVGKERIHFFDNYNKKTIEIIEKEKVNKDVVNFLYQPDCRGKIDCKTCEQILKIIGDYDDDFIYGFDGHGNVVKFSDFISILKSCAENKSDMVWV